VDDFVEPDVVAERFERLRVVIDRSGGARHTARVGGIEEVVVEGPARRDPDKLTGRTRQNKLVHFTPDGAIRPGSYADVEITGAGTHSLRGALVAVTAGPRHRTRIPVVSA
jgi:tRNA-2-methylthio-N6-dimethylallyladenosine synthase